MDGEKTVKKTIAAGIFGAVAIFALVFALMLAAGAANFYFKDLQEIYPGSPSNPLFADGNYENFKLLYLIGAGAGLGGALFALLWIPLRKAPMGVQAIFALISLGAAGGVGATAFMGTALIQLGEGSIYFLNYEIFSTFQNFAIALAVCFVVLAVTAFMRKPKKAKAAADDSPETKPTDG